MILHDYLGSIELLLLIFHFRIPWIDTKKSSQGRWIPKSGLARKMLFQKRPRFEAKGSLDFLNSLLAVFPITELSQNEQIDDQVHFAFLISVLLMEKIGLEKMIVHS